MKFRSFIGAAVLVASVALNASASAQPFVNPNLRGYARGNSGGEAGLQREIERLSSMIRAIQNDRHDDGGYRERAIADLERAQAELRRAIEYDRSHGR